MPRKRTIKKSFWIDDDEDKKLKNIVARTGKMESELFRDLINGNNIKEKPNEEFYESIKELRMLSRYLGKIIQNENSKVDSLKVRNDINNLESLILDIKRKYLL